MRWSIVTATTVGYGDVVPQTTGGRFFGTLFIIFSVSLLGRVLGYVLDKVTQSHVERSKLKRTFRKSLSWDQMHEWDQNDDGKINQFEFLRGTLIKNGDTDIDTIEDIMNLFDQYDKDGDGQIEIEELKEKLSQKAKEMQQKIEKDEKDKGNENIESLDPKTKSIYDFDQDEFILEDNHLKDGEFEYALYVEVHGCDHLKEIDIFDQEDDLWSFLFAWFGFIAYLIIGALIFSFVENASFGDMLWMFVVTSCTVGYGDQYPHTITGKLLNAFFISISVILFVITFGNAFNFIYKQQEKLVGENMRRKLIARLEMEKNRVSWLNIRDIKMKDLMINFNFNTIHSILWGTDCHKNNNSKNQNKQRELVNNESHKKNHVDNDDDDNDNDNDNYHKPNNILAKLDAAKSSKNLGGFGLFDDDNDNDDDDQESIPLKTGNNI